MIRTIIQINEEKCNGCGLCAEACHEGALRIVDGKAKLTRDDYCDGFGDCLPACPMDAITFTKREAAAYDEAAAEANKKKQKMLAELFGGAGGCAGSAPQTLSPEPAKSGCPGSRAQTLTAAQTKPAAPSPEKSAGTAPSHAPSTRRGTIEVAVPSHLRQWPVQIQLAPVKADYFQGADLLIAADCTAYAYGNFHQDFMRGKVTLVGCPKLDPVDYSEKLAEILRNNDIRSITTVRMMVPCCGGMTRAVEAAIEASGKDLPNEVVILSLQGEIM